MYIEVHIVQGILISYFYLSKKEWKLDRTVALILLFSIISDFDFLPFILGLTSTRKILTYALYMPILIWLLLKVTERYHKADPKYVTFAYITHMHSDMIGYTPTLYLYPLTLHLPTAPPEIYFNHFFIQFCDAYSIILLLLWISLGFKGQRYVLLASVIFYFLAMTIVVISLTLNETLVFIFASVVALMHFPLTVKYLSERILRKSDISKNE